MLYSSIAKDKIGNLRVPLYVVWSLTYRCNQRCLYCGIWKSKIRELSTKNVFSILDQLSSLGTKVICFSGGEPLLRDDLGKIIEYAHKKSIPHIDINSNGALVEKKIKEINSIRMLCLTFDGPEAMHDRFRGKGSYQKVLQAVEAAKKNKIAVYFRTVLTKFNLKYIEEILALANKLKVKVIFQPVTLTTYGTNCQHDLVAPDKQLREALGGLLLEKEKGNAAINSPEEVLKYLIRWPKTKRVHCLSEKTLFHLGPDGKFFPCGWGRDLKTIARKDACKLGVWRALKELPANNCRGCNNTSSLEFISRLAPLLKSKFDFNKDSFPKSF
ncbi:MAG: radical SAM protein [Candidatus Omnitrophota bacterium]